MKTFLIKAILISSGNFVNTDIGFFVKNLTYTLLKSFCEMRGSHSMFSLKSSASAALQISGAAGYACNKPDMKYSLFFHLFFQYLYPKPANFISKQDGYEIISIKVI